MVNIFFPFAFPQLPLFFLHFSQCTESSNLKAQKKEKVRAAGPQNRHHHSCHHQSYHHHLLISSMLLEWQQQQHQKKIISLARELSWIWILVFCLHLPFHLPVSMKRSSSSEAAQLLSIFPIDASSCTEHTQQSVTSCNFPLVSFVSKED